jgi:hypothetical protein
MLRNLRLIFGGLAALAVGIIGGWTVSAMLPVEASAPRVAPSVQISIPAPSVVETVPPAGAPAARPDPDPVGPAPTRTAEAPPVAPHASPADAVPSKLRLRVGLRHDADEDDEDDDQC